MAQYDIDDLKAKRLCHNCVFEHYLSVEIRVKGESLDCSYCNETAMAYRISKIAELIETAFNQHYMRTSDQPNSWQSMLLADRESKYEWDREGEPVVDAIMNAADMPEDAARDVQRILEDKHYDHESAKMGDETEFSSDSYYAEKGPSDQAWQEEWDSFEKSLKTEARFFSQTAAKLLASVFDGIDAMRTHDDRPLVVDVGPKTAFTSVYRARVFQSDEKLEEALCRPDLHLGGPTALLATAGRMNARGISVFYGANDPEVAIAEVRPPVGSQVAVARFEIIKPLRMLDLTALGAVSSKGSVFDPQFTGRLEREMFLRSLSKHMTRPIMPDDEAFEYLPTQAVADFLASETRLDGILFPSVQVAGNALNIVLFHKAARVLAIDLPLGTEISANTGFMGEDGWEIDYSVIEEVLPPVEIVVDQKETKPPLFMPLIREAAEQYDSDGREPALSVVLDSVKVHKIRSVRFEAGEFGVTRHRFEKRDPPY